MRKSAALFALWLVFQPHPASAAQVTFGSKTDFPTGSGPFNTATGDLNGDGHPDLVVANANAQSVSVLLGNGVGGFGTKTDYPTGSFPEWVVIGDVNGDGKLDLVVANYSSNTVSVLLGNGVGGFGTKTDFATGSGPVSVVIGEVNGDGKPDLVVANSLSNTVSVLLGNGVGGFGTKTDYATGNQPQALAIGDLNGDGHPDLATANFLSNTVSVLLGNGIGGFGTKTDFPTGARPHGIAMGDVSGDGNLDLVTANDFASTVSVLLGNGAGGFGTKTDFPTGSAPLSVAIGDLDLDGSPDLVTTNQNSNTVSVLTGNGQGGFGAKTDFPTGTEPADVALADLNGDGYLDLVVADYTANTASVLLNTSSGSRVQAFGYTNTPLGNAVLNYSNGVLHVTNLGSSGQDGVSIDVTGRVPSDGTLFGFMSSAFDSTQNAPPGSFVHEEAMGVLDGRPNQLVSRTSLTSLAGDSSLAEFDMRPIGATLVNVVLYRDGTAYEEFPRWPSHLFIYTTKDTSHTPPNNGNPGSGVDYPGPGVTCWTAWHGQNTNVVDGEGNLLARLGPGDYVMDFAAVNATRTLTAYTNINTYAWLPDLSIFNEGVLPLNTTSVPDPRAGGSSRSLELSARSPVASGGEASISYTLPEAGYARLGLVDPEGRLVASLVDGSVSAGAHQVSGWRAVDSRGRPLSAGVYFLRLQVGKTTNSERLVVIR